MLRIASIVVAVVIAGVLIVAAGKPDIFRVQRSASINAPPAKIYPFIEDFRRWTDWSPYEKLVVVHLVFDMDNMVGTSRPVWPT